MRSMGSFEPISDSCYKQQISSVCFWVGHSSSNYIVLPEPVFQRRRTTPCLRKGSMKLVRIPIFRNTTDNDYFQFPAASMNGGTRKCKLEAWVRSVANKTERGKWKHAKKLTGTDSGGEGQGECREGKQPFHPYRIKIPKFSIKKKKKKRHLAK